MLNTDELKIIEIIQEHQTALFQKRIKCKNNQTELLAFSINYVCSENFMKFSIKDNFEYPVDFYISKLRQYEFIAFFGNGAEIKGTHIALKDPRKFWSIFTFLIKENQYPSLQLKQIEESVNIFKRLNIPLSGRNFASYCLLITNKFWNDYQDILLDRSRLPQYISIDDLINLFNLPVSNYISDQISDAMLDSNKSLCMKSKKLTLYRGFDIGKNEYVRKNKYKKNNPVCHIQESGIGISYTYKKDVAEDFSTQKFSKNSFILNNNIEDRVSHASFLLKTAKIDFNDFLDTSNRITYVGKYEISQSDILVDISALIEDEVIALPSKLKLIEYRPTKYS